MHTHITNTRIGDVEILERRYPVLVRTFGLRSGSGGAGKWAGGEGVVRELEVLEGMQVSIMSEVRVSADGSSNNEWMLTAGMGCAAEDAPAVWVGGRCGWCARAEHMD